MVIQNARLEQIVSFDYKIAASGSAPWITEISSCIKYNNEQNKFNLYATFSSFRGKVSQLFQNFIFLQQGFLASFF